MNNELDTLAFEMNVKLTQAGCSDQWELDKDTFSNSVGTWFCGNLGGVTDADTMREHTDKLIALKSV